MSTTATVTVAHEDTETGEVTVVQVVQPGTAATTPESSENVVEEVIDAVLDPFGTDETAVLSAAAVAPEATVTTFVVAEDTATDWSGGTEDTAAPVTEDVPIEATADSTSLGTGSTATDTSGEAQEHVDAATDFQTKTDGAINAGDYEAASHLRESAENEAWAAGDASMLHGSDSVHLEGAADQQQQAEYFENEEAHHAAAGEYEAARDDAANAGFATESADFNAGGADHATQADAEYQHMDSAVFQEQWAKEDAQTAESYAAGGDLDNAAQYADSALDHQEAADYQGDLGEHGGDLADTDASSAAATVDTADSYDSSSVGSSCDSSSTDFSSGSDDSE